MKFKFIYVNHRHGAETEITVPGKYEVCDECHGTGAVLIDGLRGVAFSRDEMDEDPDFREHYFGGDYDTACDVCGGKRVVMAPDPSYMTKRQLLLWTITEDRLHAEASELAYERSMRDRGIQW